MWMTPLRTSLEVCMGLFDESMNDSFGLLPSQKMLSLGDDEFEAAFDKQLPDFLRALPTSVQEKVTGRKSLHYWRRFWKATQGGNHSPAKVLKEFRRKYPLEFICSRWVL